MTTIVDDEDFEWLNQWKWSCHVAREYVYAARRLGDKTIKMHRLIMAAKPHQLVDHKNGKTLDNRRSTNLRLCDKRENNSNVKKRSDNTSGFKGVCWKPKLKTWHAYIQKNKRWIHLGYFKEKESAARAYDEAAKKYHGEFARLNFP